MTPRRRGRAQWLGRLGHVEQIDDQIVELHDGGVVVFVHGVELEDLAIEGLRSTDVLNEEGDDIYMR